MFYSTAEEGKGIPITGHEGPQGLWMQGSTYSQATELRRGRVASPTLGHIYLQKSFGTHFEAEWIPKPVWTWKE